MIVTERRASRLTASLVVVPDLSQSERARLFTLYESLFEGASRRIFEADLETKDLVLLIEKEGEAVGFTTIQITRTRFRDQPLRLLYSGDTVMQKEHWNTTTLPRAWIKMALSIRSHAESPLYWLLLAGSYRTYKFLPLFFLRFYPRYESATPPDSQEMLTALAKERFGENFDPARGVVAFPNAPRLRAGVADPIPSRLKDPHTAFFVSRNPTYFLGVELACLCELSASNLTRAGHRMLE